MLMKRLLTILALYLSVMSIMFAQTCPDSNHPHAIDLGIGVKFACCNIGASSPEKYGHYYAWGETDEKAVYDELSYRYGGNKQHKRYTDIGNDIAGSQYDVAHVKWEGNWQMPTKEQMELLKDRCKKEWITYKRVEGCRFTGPNGNSIFLPAAGSRWYDTMSYEGYIGKYWSSTSSTQTSNSTGDSFFLHFDSDFVGIGHKDRASGSPVRPVLLPSSHCS